MCVEPQPLARLALAWPGPVRRIFVYFEADALALGEPLERPLEPGASLRPQPLVGVDLPMLRGEPCSAEHGFALSPLAAC